MNHLYSASSLNFTSGASLLKLVWDKNATRAQRVFFILDLKYHKIFNRILKFVSWEINYLHFSISVSANSLWASSWAIRSPRSIPELLVGSGELLVEGCPIEICFLPLVNASWLLSFRAAAEAYLFCCCKARCRELQPVHSSGWRGEWLLELKMWWEAMREKAKVVHSKDCGNIPWGLSWEVALE